MSETELWEKAFLQYTRDQQAVSSWIEHVLKRSIRESIETAVNLVEVEQDPPDTVTLGFSPQVIIAALAARMKKDLNLPITVVTSPEVAKGYPPVARNSHQLLQAAIREKLVKEVVVTEMTPTQHQPPNKIIEKATEKFSTLKEKGTQILDISGGTQLIPIAALNAGINRMTYTYPNGEKTVIYELQYNQDSYKLPICLKNVPVFEPDTVYLYSDPIIELDYLIKCPQGETMEKCPLSKICQLVSYKPDNKSDYIVIETESEMGRVVDKHIRRSFLSATYIPNTLFLNEGKNEDDNRNATNEIIKDIEDNCSCQEPAKRDPLYWLYGELTNMLFLGITFLPQSLLNSWIDKRNSGTSSFKNMKSPLYTITKITDIKYPTGNNNLELLEAIKYLSENNWKTDFYSKWIKEKYEKIKALCPQAGTEREITIIIPVQSGLGERRLEKLYSTTKSILEWLQTICNATGNGDKKAIKASVIYILSEKAYNSLKENVNSIKIRDNKDSDSNKNQAFQRFIREYLIPVLESVDESRNPWKPSTEWKDDSMSVTLEVYNTNDVNFIHHLRKNCVLILIAGDYAKKPLEKLLEYSTSNKHHRSLSVSNECAKLMIVNESYYTIKGDKHSIYRVSTRYGYFYSIPPSKNIEKNSELLSQSPSSPNNNGIPENLKSKLFMTLLFFKSIIIDLR